MARSRYRSDRLQTDGLSPGQGLSLSNIVTAQDREGILSRRIVGTDGADFDHMSGDGRVAPPSYNDIAKVTDGRNIVDLKAGHDIAYGGEGDTEFTVLNAGDFDRASKYLDGGGGHDALVVEASGRLDLTAATLISIETFTTYFGTNVDFVMKPEQLNLISIVFAGNGSVTLSETGNITLSGNEGGNYDLFGSAGNDAISLIGSVDSHQDTPAGRTIDGLGGDDTITFTPSTPEYLPSVHLKGGDGDDVIVNGAANATLSGGAGHDRLTGADAYADQLDGGGGGDKLYGGGKGDLLTGGKGADKFVFTDLSDSTPDDPDRVKDFSASQHDRIDLRAIDADNVTAGDQAFHLGATPGHSGDVTLAFDASTNTTSLSLFTDGDAVADALIMLSGDKTSLTAGDLIL